MPEFVFTVFPVLLNIIFCMLSVTYISQAFSKGKEKLFICAITLILGCILLGAGFLLVEKGILRLILFALSLFLFTFMYKMRTYMRVLLTAAVYLIVSAADFASLIIICSIFSLTPEETLVEPIYTLGIISSFFIAFIALFIIKHTRRYITLGSFDKRLFLVYLLPVSSLLMIFTEYAVFCNYDTSFTVDLIMLLVAMLLLITNFIIFTLTDALFTQIETEKKLQTAKVIMEKQQEEYRKLLDADGEIRRYRHDVKNFLLGVLYNLENNKTELVKESVTAQLDSFKDFDKCASAQSPLNALLSSKAENASASGVKLIWELNIKSSYSINDIDLAVLLGNLIDNAVEATEKLPEGTDKTVQVLLEHREKAMCITVTNPVKDKVDTSHLFTTKKNKRDHGFGLISVKSIAQKYNGTAVFSCENMLFKAMVLLYEKE